jgi:hypothetical protein
MEHVKIELKEEDLYNYINTFLSIVDFNSRIISNAEEIKFIPPHLKESANIENVISPLVVNTKNSTFSAEFYTWNPPGKVKKWRLSISKDGEILDSHVNVLVNYAL